MDEYRGICRALDQAGEQLRARAITRQRIEFGVHPRKRTRGLLLQFDRIEYGWPERVLQKMGADLDSDQGIRRAATGRHRCGATIGEKLLLAGKGRRAGGETRHIGREKPPYEDRNGASLIQCRSEAHPGETRSINPACDAAMGVENMRQFMRDNSSELLRRQRDEQRVADHERVPRPKNRKSRHLAHAGVESGTDDDPVNARRSDQPSHVLDQVEKRRRITRGDRTPARFRNAEHEGTNRSKCQRDQGQPDKQRQQSHKRLSCQYPQTRYATIVAKTSTVATR